MSRFYCLVLYISGEMVSEFSSNIYHWPASLLHLLDEHTILCLDTLELDRLESIGAIFYDKAHSASALSQLG